MSTMTAQAILIEWLEAHGCDGLCYMRQNGECGCGLDDLMPCMDSNNISECVPARKCEPDAEQKADGYTVAYAPADLSAPEKIAPRIDAILCSLTPVNTFASHFDDDTKQQIGLLLQYLVNAHTTALCLDEILEED
jgi:hypothetical protein